MNYLFLLMLCSTSVKDLEQQYQQNPTYKNAVALHRATAKPLLVLVGANWCRYCPKAKQIANSVNWKESGIIYAYVDLDKEPSLAKKVMCGVSSIPCFVFYTNKSRVVLSSIQTKQHLLQNILTRRRNNK